MTMENLKCFGCGGKGHMERDCPSSAVVGANYSDDKPMWCGRCSRRTRLIETGGQVARCQECHPLAHQNLAQFTRCPGCRKLVYVYDSNPCGQHATRPEISDPRPERGEIDVIIAREMAHEDHAAEVGELRRHSEPQDGAA